MQSPNPRCCDSTPCIRIGALPFGLPCVNYILCQLSRKMSQYWDLDLLSFQRSQAHGPEACTTWHLPSSFVLLCLLGCRQGGWLVEWWFVFSRIFPSDHDGAALPLPPSSQSLPPFLPLGRRRRRRGRQGMMRWNGIGRTTTAAASSCTSPPPRRKKRATVTEKGKGRRRRRSGGRGRGRDWTRNDPQVFFGADRGRSFVRSFDVGNTNSKWRRARARERGRRKEDNGMEALSIAPPHTL